MFSHMLASDVCVEMRLTIWCFVHLRILSFYLGGGNTRKCRVVFLTCTKLVVIVVKVNWGAAQCVCLRGE
jgi:hypothetical protein